MNYENFKKYINIAVDFIKENEIPIQEESTADTLLEAYLEIVSGYYDGDLNIICEYVGWVYSIALNGKTVDDMWKWHCENMLEELI